MTEVNTKHVDSYIHHCMKKMFLMDDVDGNPTKFSTNHVWKRTNWDDRALYTARVSQSERNSVYPGLYLLLAVYTNTYITKTPSLGKKKY